MRIFIKRNSGRNGEHEMFCTSGGISFDTIRLNGNLSKEEAKSEALKLFPNHYPHFIWDGWDNKTKPVRDNRLGEQSKHPEPVEERIGVSVSAGNASRG